MNQILKYWFRSLLLMSSSELVRMFYVSFQSLVEVSKVIALRFSILWLSDVLIFVMFGQPLMDYLGDAESIARNAYPALWLLNHATGMLWVILNAVIFLLLSWQGQESETVMGFIKRSFYRFFVFKIITAFILSMLFFCLVIFGIRVLPPLGVPFILGYMAIETIILQFWLASDGSQKGFFGACEKGLNFVLYNLPVIIFFMSMLWLSNFILVSVFISGAYAFDAGAMLMSTRIDQFCISQATVVSPVQFVLFRYGKLVVDFFWIASLIALYRRYCRVSYSDSVL